MRECEANGIWMTNEPPSPKREENCWIARISNTINCMHTGRSEILIWSRNTHLLLSLSVASAYPKRSMHDYRTRFSPIYCHWNRDEHSVCMSVCVWFVRFFSFLFHYLSHIFSFTSVSSYFIFYSVLLFLFIFVSFQFIVVWMRLSIFAKWDNGKMLFTLLGTCLRFDFSIANDIDSTKSFINISLNIKQFQHKCGRKRWLN